MTGPSVPAHRHVVPRGRPWTVRVAAWSAAHRWPVLVGWFVLTIGVFVVSLAAGGIRTVGATGGPGRLDHRVRAGLPGLLTGPARRTLTTP